MNAPAAITEMVRMCTDLMRQMIAMGAGMMGRGMMGGMMPAPMMWWGAVWFLLLWLALAAGVVAVVVLLLRPRRRASEALAVLQVRFARGEISAQDYEQTRRLLLE